MKIAIITNNIGHNIGGILQAYSLQNILESLGHHSYVIRWDQPFVHRNVHVFYLYEKIKSILKNRLPNFLSKYIKSHNNILAFISFHKLTINLWPFIDKYIHLDLSDNEYIVQKDKYDCIVVGSDQVWREAFFHDRITRLYLDYAQSWNILKIAYAASFGVDYWEYTIKETNKCKYLVQKFDAISVREKSGIKLCSINLGINAQHVLDPTMLLHKEDYIGIIGEKLQQTHSIAIYLLDKNSKENRILSYIVKDKGLKIKNILSNNRYIYNRALPSVEYWLKTIAESEYVFTDSFHGMVFSIIFNKPFFVYGNEKRGLTRFHNLLDMLNLGDRLITTVDDYNRVKDNIIDWKNVNEILDSNRKSSLIFLKDSLNHN